MEAHRSESMGGGAEEQGLAGAVRGPSGWVRTGGTAGC